MFKFALPAAIALSPAALSAQSVVDVESLVALEEIDVVTSDGENIGDVEDGLIGPDGTLSAVVVEAGGFLGIGDENRVLPMDRLTFQDGDFVTDLVADDIESLPDWED